MIGAEDELVNCSVRGFAAQMIVKPLTTPSITRLAPDRRAVPGRQMLLEERVKNSGAVVSDEGVR